jgi:hydroxymethylpyrimidine/phosphomethylpyrimidine kinase
MSTPARVRRVLSIAGSDSGGGAGIQADLKAFAACAVHGMTAITALTAQSTVGVTDVHHVPPAMILAQVRAVAEDIGVDAVKIGMLGRTATIDAVAEALGELPAGTPVVLDPVMISESGADLLAPDARGALVQRLLPRATVITPNLPEAHALLAAAGGGGAPGGSDAEVARALHALGPDAVVLTGGHRAQASDLFFDGESLVEITGEWHRTGAAHGSGCTHSSVLAAQLARGESPLLAARIARVMAARAVAHGLSSIGAGAGPVDVLGTVAAALARALAAAPAPDEAEAGPSAAPPLT